jgi:hypothetical protein
MKPIRTIAALALSGCLLSSSAIRADVRADEKSRVEFAGMLGRMFNMFGGKAAREGVASTVAVKGNRKATLNDSTGQIIDLDEEKVYDLDLKKKSFKVTTFAELRRQIEEARKKAEEDARKAQQQEEKGKPAERDPNQKEVEVDFDIKNTGQKKAVNGFDTHQAVMTITVREKGKTLDQSGGLVMTTDMWLAPKIAAMKEIADFDMKYARTLYGPMVAGISASQMAMVTAMYPMMKDAMAKMSAEGGKLDGTAIQTTVTMEAVRSAEQLAQESKAAEADNRPSGGGISGRLGGMLAKKIGPKKDDAGQPRSTFMTMNTEVLKVATDVAPADVAVPAGFKESK